MAYKLFCDGSSNGRSNSPGGWAWVLVKNDKIINEKYGHAKSTTNNQMELMGAICGINDFINKFIPIEVTNVEDLVPELELISDSQYVLGIASGKYTPKKNLELCYCLKTLCELMGKKIKFSWVKGHSQNQWNDYADKLSKQGKENAKKANL